MAITFGFTRPAERLGRLVVRADGFLCAAMGALMLAGAGPISAFLGLESLLPTVLVGGLLLPYGLGLIWLANRPTIERAMVLTPAFLNVLWVLGSVAILVGGTPSLTPGGWWAVALVADGVGLLALAQFYAARRLA
jgi:hypothetical protein